MNNLIAANHANLTNLADLANNLPTPAAVQAMTDEIQRGGSGGGAVRLERKGYPIGASPDCVGAVSTPLPVREVFMMALMDKLTDKPGWHTKVFDDDIVGRWRREALEQPEDALYALVHDGKRVDTHQPRSHIMSRNAFDYCVEELRNKAAYFEATGLIPTLDSAGSAVVKSDSLVTPALHHEIRAAFDRLLGDQASSVDWHPRSNGQVRNLVHPSLYPLVYGHSRYIPTDTVGVADAIDRWAGKGEVIPERDPRLNREPDEVISYAWRPSEAVLRDTALWSNRYQWLPANLAFREDGTVMFTSYINNLHPTKYPEIYRAVEKLVDVAIPAWDQCLVEIVGNPNRQRVAGRKDSRFSPYEEWILSDDSEEYEGGNPWEPLDPALLARLDPQLTTTELSDISHQLMWDTTGHGGVLVPPDQLREGPHSALFEERVREKKWNKMRDPIHPDPKPDHAGDVDYGCSTSLREKFKEKGLQVVVKMASIELTPEKNTFPQGGWHIEGQMNERIVATALYYLDSENVTPSHLAFRMLTSDEDDIQCCVGQDMYKWCEYVFGTGLGEAHGPPDSRIQNYGQIETKQGRLLAFPNVFQHRVSSFQLQDPTRPGHRRFIAIWLIDPHHRVTSTANVPPQRLDWWAEAAFGGPASWAAGPFARRGDMPVELFDALVEQAGLGRRAGTAGEGEGEEPVAAGGEAVTGARVRQTGARLPPELADMVRQHPIVAGLMTPTEAAEHRLRLMEERSAFRQESEAEWTGPRYSFCEH